LVALTPTGSKADELIPQKVTKITQSRHEIGSDLSGFLFCYGVWRRFGDDG
jgi:hypothetical protein